MVYRVTPFQMVLQSLSFSFYKPACRGMQVGSFTVSHLEMPSLFLLKQLRLDKLQVVLLNSTYDYNSDFIKEETH
jgi:hypothetical protein